MSNENQDNKVMSAKEFFAQISNSNENISDKQSFTHINSEQSEAVLKAFNYMFSDNMYKKKAALYCLFAFIANSITQIGMVYAPHDKNIMAPPIYYVLVLLGLIASFIPTGYGISCIKAIREQNNNIVLPFVNVMSNFVLGFKCMIGIAIMSLICGIIFVICMIIPAIITGILGAKVLLIMLLIFAILGGSLFISIYSPALCCIFAEKEWITSFCRIIRATKLITQCKKNYFKNVGLFIVLTIFVSILNCIVQKMLFSGILGAILTAAIISVISSYIGFVFVYIAAKSITVKHI